MTHQETYADVVTDIVTRVIREGGFVGDVVVSRVRRNKRGFSAHVALTFRGHTRYYRARSVDGKVSVSMLRSVLD